MTYTLLQRGGASAARASGIEQHRTRGRDVGQAQEVGDEIRHRLREMHRLERHIGRAGLRALRPHLQFTAKDMWEIHLLEHEAHANHVA